MLACHVHTFLFKQMCSCSNLHSYCLLFILFYFRVFSEVVGIEFVSADGTEIQVENLTTPIKFNITITRELVLQPSQSTICCIALFSSFLLLASLFSLNHHPFSLLSFVCPALLCAFWHENSKNWSTEGCKTGIARIFIQLRIGFIPTVLSLRSIILLVFSFLLTMFCDYVFCLCSSIA